MNGPDGESCRPLLDDDGQVIASVRGPAPLGPEAEVAMRHLVAAALRLYEADPQRVEKDALQDASRERIRARNARLRGEEGQAT